MKTDDITILDAALGVFLRYGFKRTTMGDIAKAAGLSRQSLYARYAGKEEVYAAGLDLFVERLLNDLTAAWAETDDLGQQLDLLGRIGLIAPFEMLRTHPDAADMIEGADTPQGRAAMEQVTARKAAAIETLLAPHAAQLARHGQTPADLAEFIEASIHTILKTALDRAHLDRQFATLKASVLALTRSGS